MIFDCKVVIDNLVV